MKTTIKVTRKELAQILFEFKAIKGMNIFASVLQATKPKCTVKSRIDKTIKNPYQSIIKVSQVPIMLNSDYVTAVVNQLEREDKSKDEYKKGTNTMPLTFGENNQFIGLYGGEFVLQYRPNDNSKPKTKYLADGKIIDKAKIVDFLPTVTPATNQGTDREVLWRKLYLSNVRVLNFNGKSYKLID